MLAAPSRIGGGRFLPSRCSSELSRIFRGTDRDRERDFDSDRLSRTIGEGQAGSTPVGASFMVSKSRLL